MFYKVSQPPRYYVCLLDFVFFSENVLVPILEMIVLKHLEHLRCYQVVIELKYIRLDREEEEEIKMYEY